MKKKGEINVRPWCVFCGQPVGRARPPQNRKLDEFDVGDCQCGAVYTSDPTGHNIGAAMVEALVYACNDDWDLAWELIPEEDYLTGRIEKYDEQSHRVIETGNLDGREIRGVLYFVRLHKEIAEIKARADAKEETVAAGYTPPPVEPERDPKRQRQRASKTEVKRLVEAGDLDGLVDLTFDDVRTLRFLQRLLYEPDDDKRWRTAHLLGQVCARLSTRQPGKVSDLLHRLFEACVDSAATPWGVVEAIGSIIAARPDIFGAFSRYLLQHTRHETTRLQALWALGSIAAPRPDLIRQMPFYSLIDYLMSPDPQVVGHLIRLLGRIRASEAASTIRQMVGSQAAVTIYEEGTAQTTTLGELASEAIGRIEQGEQKQ